MARAADIQWSTSDSADARALNSAGSDSGHLSDWNCDVVCSYAPTAVHVAVMIGT